MVNIKTRARMRSGETRTASPAPNRPDTCLFMECEEEELSEAQNQFYKKKQAEYKAVMAKLEEMAHLGAKVIYNSDNSITMQVIETQSTVGPVQGQLPGPGTPQYRFALDPKTGRVLNSQPQSPVGGPTLPVPTPTVRAATPTQSTTTTTTRAATPTRGRGRGRGGNQTVRPTPSPTTRATSPVKTSSPQVVDLTKPGVEPVGAPQPIRKAFPALSVSARPNRGLPPNAAKRSELDAKVKGLLVHTPAKFTEWLIQQGLVRSEQYENGEKLKLGIYSDGKKFPHSGGYVWIQEASPTNYTSVFRGSIFETSESSPTVLLKLIYHWACQTNIPNVAQWVKVDNSQIDSFFAACRSVCVSSVQEEVVGLGGQGKVVEVGVISLGTTTQQGHKREVRVEVLGVLDRNTKNLRLRATEPIPGASQGERFGKIFEPLPMWVHKGSKIVTDYSVDRDTLIKLGYKTVVQCSLSLAPGQRPENTNQQMMDYLKKVVPKMFQNTLSNLSTAVIQQFLDELTFRELFGQFPLACFDALIQRIASQTTTTASADDTMADRLARIAANPFLDWRLSFDKTPDSPVGVGGGGSTKRSADAEVGNSIDELVTKKVKMAKDLVGLETYYYASLPGEASVVSSEFKADMAFKCHVCKNNFINNLEFMRHLHLHVETDRETAIDMVDLKQCRYCYKDFDNETKAQEHLDAEHLKRGQKHMCRICLESFTQSTHLINHMQKVHVRVEMPYSCHICSFRSSQHKDVIEHFQNTHERTDKLQCPVCLKTTGLYGEKGYNSDTTVKFLQHLQKHEDTKSKVGLKCKKCVLKFIDEKSLKLHHEQDHGSYKEWDDVEPTFSEDEVQMPPPDEKGMKMTFKKSTQAGSLPQQAAFASQNLEDLAIYDAAGEQCVECKKCMTIPGHYVAYLCCTKCRYSSCCAKAMTSHVGTFHSMLEPVYNLGKPVLMEKEMFCCCGFSTTSGNKLAKHLGRHGCKSAYSSKEEAERAKMGPGQERLPESNNSGGEKECVESKEENKGSSTFLDEHKSGSNNGEEKNNGKMQEESKTSSKKGTDINVSKAISENEIVEGGDNSMGEDDTEKCTADDEETMDNDNEEDDGTPKPGGGMLLFGTLFKYMADKKDGDVEGNEKEVAAGDEIEMLTTIENKEPAAKDTESVSKPNEKDSEIDEDENTKFSERKSIKDHKKLDIEADKDIHDKEIEVSHEETLTEEPEAAEA